MALANRPEARFLLYKLGGEVLKPEESGIFFILPRGGNYEQG